MAAPSGPALTARERNEQCQEPGFVASLEDCGGGNRAMLLNLTEELHLGATREEVWRLLRDKERLAGLCRGWKRTSSRGG